MLGHSDSNLNITLRDGCIFLCGFVRLATVTLFAGEGCGFSFTRSLLWGWSYHPNCWCGGSMDFLLLKWKCVITFGFEVVSGLLSFIKVYLHFLLHSKIDEVMIGRPLICGPAIDQMSHPTSQLRIHASKKAIDQKSSPLLRGTS